MSNSKRIIMYSAPLKKNVGMTINLKDFDGDVEKREEYIKKLKLKQKLENAEFRKKNKEQKMKDLDEIIQEKLTVPKNPYSMDIHFSNRIEMILDPNTGNSTAIFGSSKTGKSTLMMYLYNKYYASDPEFLSTLFTLN